MILNKMEKEYNPKFVKRVIEASKKKADLTLKNNEGFLKQLEEKNINDHENPKEIKHPFK